MTTNNKLNNNFIKKDKKSLSDFNKIVINEDCYEKYEKWLKHVRINSNTNGYMYRDKQNLVAIVNVENKGNEIWINALEVSDDYKGFGLGKELLNIAVKKLKATHLSVNKNNDLAISMYYTYGFKKIDETDKMIFMSIKKSINESTKNSSISSNREILLKVIELNKRLSSYDYGYRYNGKNIPVRNDSDDKFDNYTTLDPIEFNKYKIGSCWDYMLYQKVYLDSKNIDNINIYVDTEGNLPRHTFTIVPYENTFLYLESAYLEYQGVWVFQTLDEIIRFVISNMMRDSNVKSYYRAYQVSKDFNSYGLTPSEFMKYMIENSIKIKISDKKNIPKPIKVYNSKEVEKRKGMNESTMSLYSILNEAVKKANNPEDEGTDFSFGDDGKNPDPAAEETPDEPNPDEGDGGGDDFSVDDPDDDTPADDTSQSDDMFSDDPANNDDADPDSTDSDTTEDAPIESEPTNEEDNIVQPKIVKVSTLNKALMKQKMYEHYKSLQTYINSIKDLLDDNRILISDDDREICLDKINDIGSGLDMYIKHKFYNNNYEINLQNYTIFSKKMDDLLTFIDSFTKHKNKDD